MNSEKRTHDSSNAETTFRVFHSRTNESIKDSHEFLKRARAGDTAGGDQSSGNGNGWPVAPRITPVPLAIPALVAPSIAQAFIARSVPEFDVPPTSLLLVADCGKHASIMRCISGRLTSASSNIRATLPKYREGRRRRKYRYRNRGRRSVKKCRDMLRKFRMPAIDGVGHEAGGGRQQCVGRTSPHSYSHHSCLSSGVVRPSMPLFWPARPLERLPDRPFSRSLSLNGSTGMNGSSRWCPRDKPRDCQKRRGELPRELGREKDGGLGNSIMSFLGDDS